jgi:glutathione S-transferase
MTSSLPILYSFRRCPYAMRARLALYSAKIAHEHREVDLKNKPLEMLEISPKGTVPVLQLEDGAVLEESFDIMRWSLNTSSLSLASQQLITENDTIFKRALDRYKYPNRYPEGSAKDYRSQCEEFLKKIETILCPYLEGDDMSLTDMAIFPFVRQFAMVDPEWFHDQPYPKIKRWLKLFMESNLFQKIMQNYPVWVPGQQPIVVTL